MSMPADPALSTTAASSAPPLSLLLRDLTAYAQSRLAAGDASEAMGVVEADVPDLVAAYGLGYLPPTYREALPPLVRPLLSGRRIARCLWLPATDQQGIVVDALAVHARPHGGAYVGWCAEPRGLLGAGVITAFPDLIVCDNLRVLARCFRRGLRHALLMRGAADALHNADRLAAAGVRRVELRVCRHAAAYADALRAAGIQVRVASHVLDAGAGYFAAAQEPVPFEPPPESDPHAVEEAAPSTPGDATAPVASSTAVLELVHHDRRQELATFRAGSTTYVLEAPADGRTTLDVAIRHGDRVQRDRFDLAVPVARERFAGCAALRCSLPAPVIAGHLGDLLVRVRDLAAEEVARVRPPQPAPVSPDAAQVREWLAAPDLLGRVAADLDALGWVGEDAARRLAYLVSVSRKTTSPLWCQRLMPPGAGSSGIDVIAELTPPEDVIRVSRLSAATVDHLEPGALRHSLLVVDDGAAISDDAVLALRIIQARGAIAVVQPRWAGTGATRPTISEVRGPIALLTATSRRLDDTLAAACLRLPLDDSPAQTARVIATQGRAYTARADGEADDARQAIRARHHALQRALACRPVVIAGVDRISFPAVSVQDRRDHALFLGIVAAHALLHQHQRLSDGAAVVADDRDITAAIGLAAAAGIGTARPLSAAAGDLLALCGRAGLGEFTMGDVADLRPGWTTYTARGAVAELVAAERVAVVAGGGQGRRVTYRIVGDAAAPVVSRIRLISATCEAGRVTAADRFPKGATEDSRCG